MFTQLNIQRLATDALAISESTLSYVDSKGNVSDISHKVLYIAEKKDDGSIVQKQVIYKI